MSELRTQHFRTVLNRAGKRSHRWRWAVESKKQHLLKPSEWRLEKSGWAWTRGSARRQIRNATARLTPGYVGDMRREETLIVRENAPPAWAKPDAVPTPLPSRHFQA